MLSRDNFSDDSFSTVPHHNTYFHMLLLTLPVILLQRLQTVEDGNTVQIWGLSSLMNLLALLNWTETQTDIITTITTHPTPM